MESLMAMLKSHSADPDAVAWHTSYADLFAFLAKESRTLQGKVLRPFVRPELQAIVVAQSAGSTGKGAASLNEKPPHLKRSGSLSLAPSSSHASSSSSATASASVAGSSLSPEICKLLLSFLTWLSSGSVSVSAPARTLPLSFDFGSAASGDYVYLDTPSLPTWVLSSGFAKDRFVRITLL
jgi:hypothetical protein